MVNTCRCSTVGRRDVGLGFDVGRGLFAAVGGAFAREPAGRPVVAAGQTAR
jgi:hypothetical protein